MQTILHIRGMSCNHCVQSVQKVILSVAGVTTVAVDLENGTALITHENVEIAKICAAIDEIGFEASA